jgi:Zn-dependent protease
MPSRSNKEGMGFDLADGINWYLVFLFSTSCHEAAHAWSASLLGDDTARAGGQVTLDPTPHIRRAPFGMVVVPILSYLSSGSLLGWANAPYSVAWAQAYPRRCAAMALAGPLANILLAVFAMILIRAGCEWNVFQVHPQARLQDWITLAPGTPQVWLFAAKILGITIRLNILLAAFNLIPLPPLDGGSLPLFVLPRALAVRYWSLIHSPSATWIGLFAAYRLTEIILPVAYQIGGDLLKTITRF